MFSVATSKLTGTPGASGWAQIHEFVPEEEEKRQIRGHLIAVVSTQKNQEGVDAVSAGREIIARLHEEYFGKEEGTAFNALKSALQKVIDEFGTSWGEVEIVAAAVVGDIVYTATGGGGKVAIFRDGILANILEGKEATVTCASGYPKGRDLLLLGTNSFFENFPVGVIRAGLATGSPEACSEYFAPLLAAKGDSGSIGVATISFRQEEKFGQKAEEEKAIPIQAQRFSFPIGVKISSFLGNLAKMLPERKIYVHMPEITQEETGRRKTTLTIGVILLILLLVSIGFGIKAKRDREGRSRYEATLTEASHELSEAEGLYSINPDRARELLASSRDKVQGLLNQKISDPELTGLKQKIEEDEGRILGEYREEPEVFIDLSLLSSGFNGDELVGESNTVYVLDQKGKKIISVALGNKRSEVVAGPDEVGNAIHITAYEDRVFVLTDSGIYEVTANKKKVIDKDWTDEVWLYAYTGNIYLLDKGSDMIWRYQGSENTFGTKQKWFGPSVSADFSSAVSWAIDGSVWVIGGDGQILKFTMGKGDAFMPTGVTPSLDSATAIYTDENLKFVYILQPKRNRVLVLSKDGKFAAQYLSDKIANATGLAVSEEQKKIILLLGNKLYSIELKHL